jgi:ATPase inhibitor, mitochondrial
MSSALKTIAARQLPRLSTATTATSATRSFSVATRLMAGGDTGAPRSGGSAQGDAWTKREHANEDYTIRQREMEKLKALKAKIAESEVSYTLSRPEEKK